MILVITDGESTEAVLSKSGKKPIDIEALDQEYFSFHTGSDLEAELSKNPENMTKKGTVRASVFQKALKARHLTFDEFLIQEKKFKKVDFVSYDY